MKSKTFFYFSIVLLLAMACNSDSLAQQVSVIKITDLEKRMNTNSDTTFIINFWATWCSPCVKELPEFDSIGKVYISAKVKVLLVSMDFKEDLATKLLPFMNKRKVQSEVVLLDETNGNYFIPKISEQWSGALPATLILNNKLKVKRFYEKKLTFAFLKSEIESIK